MGYNPRIAIVVLALGATAINGFVAWQSWNDVQSTNAIAKANLDVDAKQDSRDSTAELKTTDEFTKASARAIQLDLAAAKAEQVAKAAETQLIDSTYLNYDGNMNAKAAADGARNQAEANARRQRDTLDNMAKQEMDPDYARVDADLKREMADSSRIKTWAAVHQPTGLIISEIVIVVMALVAIALVPATPKS